MFLKGFPLELKIKNLIHKETQVKEKRIYLTVKNVYSLPAGGKIDFSGKELVVGEKKPILPEKASSEEKYGWWHLKQGVYLVEFNETFHLDSGEIALIQPREELLENLSFHPTLLFFPEDKIPLIPLVVGPCGISIKQNARISVLFVVSTGKEKL
ncbi:dCTP deaminase [Candidatus Aerophobetes bacterium]|nr:dCTP deaminase [Candidatus Aerophobetes bacterium]